MKNTIKFLIALFLIAFNIYGQDKFSATVDKIMDDYMNSDLFSGVVLISKDGVPVYERSFGYSDWESKSLNNTNTLFNIGSLNKLFTRVIVEQLAKEDVLSLNDKLSKYLNIFPDGREEKITITHLLDMSSGLGDYLTNEKFRSDPAAFITVDDFMQIIKNEPLLFEPGSTERYSNSGYVVLGAVIEKVTGRSYLENLNERILGPYRMANTHYLKPGEKADNMAVGTLIDYKGIKKNSRVEASPSPAGGMFSNVYDLLKFDNALRSDFEPGVLGIFAGGTPAWNAVIDQYDRSYSVIILSNFGRAAESVERSISLFMEGKDYRKPVLPADMQFYKLLKDGGINKLKDNFRQILEENNLLFSDMHLNRFGYALLQNRENKYALEVFNLNADLFPGNINVYDSLGEAYLITGDKINALKNYGKVLELDPGNQNAKEKIEQLNNN